MKKLSDWKIEILKNNFDIKQNFLDYPGIKKFKTKFKIKIIQVANEKFIDVSEDKSLIPSELIISNNKDSTLVKCNFNKNSKYELVFDCENVFIIEKKSKKKMDLKVCLVKENPVLFKKIVVNNKEWFVKDFIQIVGVNRISIMPYDGCIHWNKKTPCKFCDSNPKKSNYISPVPSLNNLQEFNSTDEWWDNYKKDYLEGLTKSYSKLIKNINKKYKYHFQFMTGNIYPDNKAWDITLEIINELNKIFPITNFNSYLNLGYVKKNQKKYLTKMKAIGFKNIQLNLEVIGEKKFNETCPGKSKILDYVGVINLLKKATKIFGRGYTRSNFVFGLQNTEELLKGIEELAKLGIVSDYSLFIPKPGTSYSQKTRPEFNTIMKFNKSLADIYKKYDFNPIYDNYSSRSNALHELLKGV